MSLLSNHGSSIDSNFYWLYFITLSSILYFIFEKNSALNLRHILHTHTHTHTHTYIYIYIYNDIHCNWVSGRWQWSVNLYKNRKETAIYKRRNTQNNTKTQNSQTENIHTKQENKHKKNIKTHKSSNYMIRRRR